MFIFTVNCFNFSTTYFVFGIDVNKTTNISSEESQLIFLNLERIDAQIDLTSQNLRINNTEVAFYHSYIPHSVIYPTIKLSLVKLDPYASSKLEGLLTDLPIITNSKNAHESQSTNVFSSVSIDSNLEQIQDIIRNMTNSLLANRVNGSNPG